MNVLFLTCWYPDSENPAAGVFIKEHAVAISKQADIHLKVLQIRPTKGRGIYRKEIEVFTDENGIETHRVLIFSVAYKLIYLFNRYLKALAYAYAKKYILPDWKPDLIHGNVVFQAGVIGNYLAKKLRVPFFLSEHWSGLDWYLKTPYVQSAAGVRAYKEAKRIFPVSHHLKGIIANKISDTLPVQVVPNVVDTSLFRFAGAQVKSEKVKLICVTSFKSGRAVFKLPGLILDALELMTDAERDNYEIRFVGGGDGLKDFEKRIQARALSDSVSCLGFRQKQEVAVLMQSADALIHPSIAETFGVVVAEALCCGTPCVVSDVPALDELIREDCGIKVQENTADAWKKALIDIGLNRAKYDRQAIAKRAVSLFNQDRVGKMIVENY